MLLILLSTNWSPEAKPASAPVSGVINPMVMVPPVAGPPAPFMPELQALRNPPAPTASAPAPMPFSKERRAIGRSRGTPSPFPDGPFRLL